MPEITLCAGFFLRCIHLHDIFITSSNCRLQKARKLSGMKLKNSLIDQLEKRNSRKNWKDGIIWRQERYCLEVSHLEMWRKGHRSFKLFCFHFLFFRPLLHWILLFPGTGSTNSWAPELRAGKQSPVKNMTTNKGFGCPTPESQERRFKWKNLCWISKNFFRKLIMLWGKRGKLSYIYLLK